jgi:hypothetical protein
MPLQIGLDGYKGLQITPIVAGPQTLTAYVAHKLFGNPAILPSRFRLFVRAPVGADDWREYNSQLHGAWMDDGSVWHEGAAGDTLTPRRWELFLSLDASALASGRAIDVRAEYDAYDPQGYLYFDPLLQLVPESNGGGALFAPFLAPAPMTTTAVVESAPNVSGASFYFVTSGDKYHLPDCLYAKTGVAMTPAQIVQRDGIPCKRCNPPLLGGSS